MSDEGSQLIKLIGSVNDNINQKVQSVKRTRLRPEAKKHNVRMAILSGSRRHETRLLPGSRTPPGRVKYSASWGMTEVAS